jgi:hypothetical protein
VSSSRADGATRTGGKSRRRDGTVIEIGDYSASRRFMIECGRPWTTYGIADEHGMIRYVGSTMQDLPERLCGHIAAARSRAKSARQPTRWLRWLKEHLAHERALSIVEISVDTDRWSAIEKERTVIAGLTSAGADLLNTHEIGRRRCLRCGWLDYPGSHACLDVCAARVSYVTKDPEGPRDTHADKTRRIP